MARPPKDRQIRINEILDVAEPMFYAKGYHETAISDIVKQMGVAQGTFYYYFKSKEEILEALINRFLIKAISEAKMIAGSTEFLPPQRIEYVIQAMIRTIKNREEGLLFEYLYNDRTLHIVDKLARQGKQLITPLLLKVVEDGIQQNYFRVSYPLAAVNLIMSIVDSLIKEIYEKSPDELLICQFHLAETLIARALGMEKGTIHICK